MIALNLFLMLALLAVAAAWRQESIQSRQRLRASHEWRERAEVAELALQETVKVAARFRRSTSSLQPTEARHNSPKRRRSRMSGKDRW